MFQIRTVHITILWQNSPSHTSTSPPGIVEMMTRTALVTWNRTDIGVKNSLLGNSNSPSLCLLVLSGSSVSRKSSMASGCAPSWHGSPKQRMHNKHNKENFRWWKAVFRNRSLMYLHSNHCQWISVLHANNTIQGLPGIHDTQFVWIQISVKFSSEYKLWPARPTLAYGFALSSAGRKIVQIPSLPPVRLLSHWQRPSWNQHERLRLYTTLLSSTWWMSLSCSSFIYLIEKAAGFPGLQPG